MRVRRRHLKATPEPFHVDAVTSADGTTIGFRRYGAGPGLLLIHGGMNAAQDLADLASLLSDGFTVIVPDRRGRGVGAHSGPTTRSPKKSTTCERSWTARTLGSSSASAPERWSLWKQRPSSHRSVGSRCTNRRRRRQRTAHRGTGLRVMTERSLPGSWVPRFDQRHAAT